MKLPFNELKDIVIGKELQTLRTFKTVGKGGYSKVVLIDRVGSLSDKYAMKIINKQEEMNLDYVWNEIRIHSSLDHPNIVKFHQYFEDKEKFYLIMDYQPNGNLGEYIQ